MIKGNILVYTHTDLDGYGSNLICNYIENNYDNIKFTIKNLNYDEINGVILEDIDNDILKNYDEIFITDISVNEDVANKLNKINTNNKKGKIHLFDHHKSAEWLNKYKWCKVTEFNTLNNEKTSGTELFYEYLVLRYENDEQNLIDIVNNIKLYDTWLWNEHNNTIPKKLNDLFLLYGFEEFEKQLIKCDYNVNVLIETNQFILDIQQNQIDKYINEKNKTIIEKEVDNIKLGVVFADKYISELGNELAKLHSEFNIIAIINPSTNTVSYRSIGNNERNNCSEFAKKYLGGGHFNSSGSSINYTSTDKYISSIFNLNK